MCVTGFMTLFSSTAPAVTPPAAPSSLTATAVSDSQINLAWVDNSDDEDDFYIERADNSGFTVNLTNVVKAANSTSHNWSGLSDNKTYYFRVKARNVAGSSGWSNTANDTTDPTPPSPPAAPSGLSTTTISQSQVKLDWTDNAGNEDGFHVYRNGSLYQTLATPNLQTYTASGLAEGTSYDWKVRAYNAGGNSAFTSTVAGATQLATPSTGTLCTPDSGTTVRVRWTDQSGHENNYEIFKNGSSHTTVAADVELYEASAVAGDTWKVRAIAAALPDSDFTSVRTVPTPATNLIDCPG